MEQLLTGMRRYSYSVCRINVPVCESETIGNSFTQVYRLYLSDIHGNDVCHSARFCYTSCRRRPISYLEKCRLTDCRCSRRLFGRRCSRRHRTHFVFLQLCTSSGLATRQNRYIIARYMPVCNLSHPCVSAHLIALRLHA